jgi:signal transduction histidine kinase/ligand-binding sensor domain-containing protein/DNA-binding response OmpR family regulator
MIKAHTFLYIFFLLSLSLSANELYFSQISFRNGLSPNTVRAVVEDKNGFIWAGTLDGLKRYDGYNIRSYRSQVGDTNAPGDIRIRDMFVARNGYLWIKTYRNEFSCYNPVTESSVHSKGNEGKPLRYESYYESTDGDIWLWGRTDGVVRLRKNSTNIFEQETILPQVVSGGECHFLFEDSEAAIWIGGEHGLIRINENARKDFYSESRPYSFTQAVEIEDKLFFSTMESTVVIYDRKQKKFSEAPYEPQDALLAMACLSTNELLLITRSQGLLTFHIHTKAFKKSELNKDADLTGDIRLIVDKHKGIWIYNHSGIVWYYNRERQEVKKMRLIPEGMSNMIDLERYTVFIDSSDMIWITTYGNGLFSYNPANDNLVNYTNNSEPNSIASDYLLSITEDRYGTIWVGSEYAGIIRIVKPPDYIRIIRPEAHAIIGKTNNVRTIYEDSHNNVWVGTKNGSLYVYNPELTKGKCIGESLNPYTLIEDTQQRMWIGTKGNGLYVYDAKTFREIAHFRHQERFPSSLSHDVIFHIITDNKNRMWIGSFGGGLSLVEESGPTVSFRHFIRDKGSKSLIRYLLLDVNGMVWAGSSDGLITFDPDELIRNPEAYTCYTANANQSRSLSSNDIKTIHEDKDHAIWIGTAGGGLNKFVEATPQEAEHFVSFTVNNGMPDNYVLGILEHENHLWISSDSGLSRFNKADFSIVTYQFAQKSFGNIFNEGAYCQRRNGVMLWGNLDGLLVFDPNKFKPDSHIPPVLLTGLQVDGSDWNVMKHSPSDKSITYTKNIQLSYKQNTLTIEFATLTLRNPEKNQYTYILEDYDKSWSIPAPANTATYKNLPHGKYIFKVKGANPDGVWSDEITSLEIIIAPPFRKSTFAYIIYFILTGVLFYMALRIILKFNRLNNAVEVEKQLTNHKLLFFTNISHEFRTPLTLIQGAVEKLNDYNELSVPVKKQINVLSKNSANLKRLIDQLLEFRKLQNDVLGLNLESIDIVAFSWNIYAEFQELATQKNIQYLFTSSDESLLIYIDRKKMDKILYNLLSNAFKFTPKNGLIELILTQNMMEHTCTISVKDNGIGIPKEKQHLLFRRFTQINYSTSGTGIGLSLVKEFVDVHKGKINYEANPDGGSIFNVALSTEKETYKGANFVNNTHPDIVQENYQSSVSDAELIHDNSEIDSETLADYQLLIIEDNDDIRIFLTDEFCKYLNVDTASNGKEGLQKAIETNPDIIICDIMMPEMDGFEVTRQLKTEFQTCHIPIILLTANSSIEYQLEGIESGADAYITKPFSLKYIVKRVMRLVEQRELLKKRFSKEFVVDEISVHTTKQDKAFFEKVEQILEENYVNSNFTITKFIELSHTRRTIFFKKVKGITGYSPNELLKIKRLNKSAALLKEGNWTVSEISYKVGFDDPYYFSKCFKSHFNCSPSKYKTIVNSPSS